MRIKDGARRMASGAGVALATAGLSTCNHGGAVDPPPPPFECTAGIRGGESLFARGTLNQTELRVEISNSDLATWDAAQATDVVGGTARPVALGTRPLVVIIDLKDDTVRSGSFKLNGTLRPLVGTGPCAVSRTFVFSIGASGVVVARADALPLGERQPACIALLSQRDRDVEVEATTAFDGPTTFAWTITGGQIIRIDGPRLRWRLPDASGLYQVELVADYGPAGFAFDALVLEVG